MLLKKYWHKIPKSALILFAVLIAVNGIFFYYSPDEIVKLLGVDNSYLIVFLIASFGGLSSFTSVILYSAIATFAAGGTVPWLLGITAGIGIGIGDSIIFSLLTYGYSSMGKWNEKKVEKYRLKIARFPVWAQYIMLYILLGFTPIPNDIVLVLLVLLGYKKRVMIPILFISGITIAILTAYTGKSLLDMFF